MKTEITFKDSVKAAHLEFEEEPMDKNYSNLIAGYPSRLRIKKILQEIERNSSGMGVDGMSILDAGCEAGFLSIKLMEKGADVTSVDIIKPALKRFKDKIRGTSLNPKIVNAAIQNLPFKDSIFDGVVATEVLEHAPDLKKCISELHRVATPGGVIIITIPIEKNRKWLYPIAQLLGINTSVEKEVTLFDISIEDILEPIHKIGYAALVTYSFPKFFPLTRMIVWTKQNNENPNN